MTKPLPRMMTVSDNDVLTSEELVFYLFPTGGCLSVSTSSPELVKDVRAGKSVSTSSINSWVSCKEIEEPKEELMTCLQMRAWAYYTTTGWQVQCTFPGSSGMKYTVRGPQYFNYRRPPRYYYRRRVDTDGVASQWKPFFVGDDE